MAQLSQWTAEQLVFLDESAASERNKDRKFGWAPVGVPAAVSALLKRSERWSVLPAYTVDGYMAWEVRQGSYTTEFFNAFVQDRVLPECSPFPGPRSVLVLDNASIHRNQVCFTKELDDILLIYVQALIDMCEEAGVQLEYLPPYSPDFNPIEQSFAQLKAWMRKHHAMALSCGTFEDFLMLALEKFSVGGNPGAHFRSAHIKC